MSRLAWLALGALAIAFACAPLPRIQASVVGIDLGTDWFKVSIVKTGVPLDMVLNRESKRKTASTVLIRDGVRHFGSDATSLEPRFPSEAYGKVKNLLGRLFEDPVAATYRSVFQNTMVRDPVRGTVAFKHVDKVLGETTFPLEELIAMTLSHAKQQAEEFGKEPVGGAVITVPPYANQFERQALLDAAEIAGLRVYTLMNDETAVALNYAMTRTFTQPEYHIFYDFGAGSTVASLVKFYPDIVHDKYKRNKTVPTIDVQAIGYDRTLGGNEFDVRIQKYLADGFMEQKKGKVKGDIRKDIKAMTKLLREANRVKHILSANTETMSSVEGLYEDVDFKLKVTRADFEPLVADLFDRVAAPIKTVLKLASLDLKDVNSLVLVGGNTRIPMVQKILEDFIGPERMARNVNADEASVMGAGFHAAGLSKLFRVKEIGVKDIHPSTVDVTYESEPTAEPGAAETGSKPYRATLFAKNSYLGAKKLMLYRRQTDFSWTLEHKDMPPAEAKLYGTGLLKTSFSTLTSTIQTQNTSFPSPKVPKIKALIKLDTSGILRVEKCYAEFDVTPVPKEEGSKGGFGAKVLNFFGIGDEDKDGNGDVGEAPKDDDEEAQKEELKKRSKRSDGAGEDDEESDPKQDKEAESDGQPKESESVADEAKSEETAKPAKDGKGKDGKESKDKDGKDKSKAKGKGKGKGKDATNSTEKAKGPTFKKIPLDYTIEYLGVQPMSNETKASAVERLASMDKEDHTRLMLATARNNLEGYVFSGKDWLTLDQTAGYSVPEERDALLALLKTLGEWLDDETGPNTTLEEYQTKLSSAKALRDVIESRISEAERRPDAISRVKRVLDGAREFVETFKATPEADKYHGEEEVKALETLAEETEDWLRVKVANQKKVEAWKDPVLTVWELEEKGREVDAVVLGLTRRRKPVAMPKVDFDFDFDDKTGDKAGDDGEDKTGDDGEDSKEKTDDGDDTASKPSRDAEDDTAEAEAGAGGDSDASAPPTASSVPAGKATPATKGKSDGKSDDKSSSKADSKVDSKADSKANSKADSQANSKADGKAPKTPVAPGKTEKVDKPDKEKAKEQAKDKVKEAKGKVKGTTKENHDGL